MRGLPRFLLLLAVCEYLSKGIFLGLFTNGFDFASFYNAAASVAHGDGARIYDSFFSYAPGTSPVPMFFLYPAPVALMFAPLGLFSFPTALALFQLFSHACLWAALALWMRGRPDDERALGAALVLLFFPVSYSLQVGQAEPLVLLLLLGTAAFHTRGRSSAAGFLLAAAICLKLFLLFLLVYFFLRRSRRLLAWALFWLLVLFGASALVVPWEVQAQYWSRVGSPLGFEAFTDNQSITGFVHRTLTRTRFASGFADSLTAALAVKGLLTAAVLAAYAWLVAYRSRETELFGRDYGFTLVTIFLVAPIVDTHHYALLVIPFLGLLAAAPRDPAHLFFYAFFARWEPLVAYKFLSTERLAFLSASPSSLLYSLPFFVMAAFWLHTARRLSADEPKRP